MAVAAEQNLEAQPVLEIRSLVKRFGVVEVLRSISLEMGAGEFLVLVGPSGCGKSTLLNCIAGLETTSGGEIIIGGQDVTQVPPRDRDIAMVFQSYALYPTMTVAENIAFGMKVRNVPKEVQQKKLKDVAGLLQIEHLLERKPGALSGGQRQRVAMGRALVREPTLFLFDEPLSNLDAKLRVELRSEIKKLHERLGASIVYVTHDQIEAMTLGTRIVVLNGGLIQQIGTPEEIYERPANLFVADFMGSPPMNLIPAEVTVEAGIARVRIKDGQSIDTSIYPAELAAFSGRPIILGIRPEAFEAGPGAGVTVVPTLTENAGADTFVEFEIGGQTIIARLHRKVPVETGKPLDLHVDLGSLCYFDPDSGLRIG